MSEPTPHTAASPLPPPEPAPPAQDTDTPPPRRRPLWWRAVRGVMRTLAVLIVLVVVLIGVALLLLQTDWGRARALELVLDYLNGQIRGELRAERLAGNVLDDLTLHGVVVLDPEGELVARADSLYIDHSLLPLFVGDVVIHDARVESPEFVLLDREGRVGIMRAFEVITPQPLAEPFLDLGHLEIVDGSLRLSPEPDSPGVLELDASLGVGVDDDRFTWRAAVVGGRLVNAPFDVIERFELRSDGYYDPDTLLEFDRLELDAAGLSIALRGSASDFGPNQPDPAWVDLTIDHIHGDLGTLGQLPPGTEGDLPLLGTATVTGRIAGPLAALAVALRVETAEAGRLTVAGTAGYDLEREVARYDLALTLRDGNPSKLVAGLPAITASLSDLELDLALRGHGMPDAPDGELRAVVDVRSLQGNAALARLAPLTLLVGVRQGGRGELVLQTSGRREADAPSVRVEASLGSVFGLPTPVTASWQVRALDLSVLTGLPGLESLAGLQGQVARLEGQGSLRLTEAGARDVDLVTTVDASRLVVPPSLAEALDAPARAGHLAGEVALRWAGPGAAMSGRIDLAADHVAAQGASARRAVVDARLEPQRGGRTHLAGTATLEDARFEESRVGYASGPFDLVLGPGGTIPSGTLDLSVRDVVSGESRVGAAQLDVALSLDAKGRLELSGPVSVDDLRQGPDLRLGRFSGTLALLRRADGSLTLEVPDLDASDLRTPGQSLGAVSGPVSVSVAADGAIEATLDVDASDIRFDDTRVGTFSGPLEVSRAASGALEAEGTIDARDVRSGDTSVGRVQGPVDVSVDAQGGVEASGALEADDVRSGDTSVGHVQGPFDVSVDPDGSIDATADVDARDVRSGDASVGRVQGPVDVSVDAQGDVDATADVDARDVRAGGARIGSVEGPIELEVGAGGGPTRAQVDVAARDVSLDGQRIERARLQGTVRISGEGARQRITADGTVRAESLRAQGDVHADVLTARVSDLELRGAVPQGGTVTLDVEGARIGERRFEVLGARAELGRGGTADVVLEGRSDRGAVLEAELRLQLPVGGEALEARIGQARVVGASGLGLQLAPGSELRLGAGGALVARDLRIEGLGGLPGWLELDADWQPSRGRYELELEAHDIPLRAWLDTLEDLTGLAVPLPRDIDGRIDLVADFSGDPDGRPEGKLTLRLRDASGLAVLEDIDVDLDLYLDAEELFLTTSTRWGNEGELELDLELPGRVVQLSPLGLELHRDTPFELEGTLVGVDLAAFRDVLPTPAIGSPARGAVTGEIFVDGTLGEPRGAVTAQFDDFGLGPLSGVDGGLEALIEPEQMVIEAELVRASNLATEPLLTLDARVPFNPISLIVEPDPMATVQARLEAEGLEVDLVLAEIALSQLPYTEQLPAQLEHARVAVNARLSGTPSSPQMSIAARGVVPDLLVQGEDVVLAFEVSDAPLDGRQQAVLDDGAADDLYGRLVVESPAGGLVVGSMRLPEAMAVVFEGRSPRTVVLDERFWLELTAQLDADDLSRLLPRSAQGVLAAMPQPRLGARLEVVGGEPGPSARLLAALESSEGRGPVSPALDAETSKLESLGAQHTVALADQLRVVAEMGPSASTLDAVLVQREAGSAPLELELALDAGTVAVLDGEIPDAAGVRGRLASAGYDLRGLEALLPDVFAPTEGRLVADATISGTYGDPELRGRLVAVFDVLRIEALGLEREDFTLTVTLDEDAIRLQPIRLEEDGGTLEFYAVIETPSLDPSEMELDGELDLRNFPLLARPDITARLSGELDLEGTLAAPDGSGSFVVEDAEIEVARLARELAPTEKPLDVIFVEDLEAETLARSLERLRREQAAERAATAEALADAESRFEIDFVVPRYKVRVVHPLFDVSVWGDLELVLVGAVPIAEGLLNLEGSVNLYGRTFELAEDSRVIFRGVPGIDPRLQITAVYDISDVDLSPLGLTAQSDSRIYVDVSGTVSEPVLELRSDPPMDQTNIASIVAFGAPTGAAEDDADAIQQQTANLFVGLISGQLGGLVEEDLPVDVLTVSGEGRVTVGKRISKRLIVLYRGTPGAEEDENANEIQAKLRILDWLNLEARFGDAGLGTVDLLFRRQW